MPVARAASCVLIAVAALGAAQQPPANVMLMVGYERDGSGVAHPVTIAPNGTFATNTLMDVTDVPTDFSANPSADLQVVFSPAAAAGSSWRAHPAASRGQMLAFENATIVDGTDGRLHHGMTVLIEGDRIRAIQPTAEALLPDDARRVSAAGKFVIPGLIETHAHWFAWFAGRPDPIDAAVRGAGVYLANGITTIVDASARNRDADTLKMRTAVKALRAAAPHIIVSGRVDAQSVKASGAADAGELTRRLLAQGVDGIKIRDGITEADLPSIVVEARRAGRPVYGHTYGLRQGRYHDHTRAAVELGVNGIFHIGGMAPVDPALEPAMPRDASWQQQWLHGSTRWLAVNEASADTLIASMIRRVVAGTDGVPIQGFGLQEELRLLVDAGLSPLAAIRAATVNAARAFSLGDSVGRLEAGARADIVLLDANPLEDIRNTRQVHGVVRAGEYFDRRALDECLRKAEQAR